MVSPKDGDLQFRDPSFHDLRHQPVQGLYLVYQFIITLLIRIPCWVISNMPRSRRPRKSWSLQRTVIIRLLAHLVDITNRTGPLIKFPDHLAIPTGEEGICGVWVPPVPPSLILGKLKLWAKESNVIPVRIPGYWIFRDTTAADRPSITAPPIPGEKVMYYLHGGAYIMLSAHPTYTAAFLSTLFLALPNVRRAFAVEYRLSSGHPYTPAAPFPAALIDALSGYLYLVDVLGFAPKDILIAGDSAGGNLALALTRYLIEHNHLDAEGGGEAKSLPPTPGRLLLLSPLCDMSTSHYNIPGSTMRTNARSDYVGTKHGPDAPATRYVVRAFLGPSQLCAGGAERNPYISPASLFLDDKTEADFTSFPRTMIVAGDAEMLMDQIETLMRRMVRDLGTGGDGETGKVTFHAATDAVHDFLIFPWFEPQRTNALRAISEWFMVWYTEEADLEMCM